MSRMVIFLAIAVVLFGVAAGGSWYFQQQQMPDPEHAKAGEDKGGKASSVSSKPNAADGPAGSRPLILPPINASADQLAKYSKGLQEQQESLKARGEQLDVRRKQLDLFHLQVVKEQKNLEGTKKEVQAELALLLEKLKQFEEKVAELETIRKQLARERSEFDDRTRPAQEAAQGNLKKIASMYDGMDPEDAAQNIEKLVVKGQVDVAASILTLMNTRKSPAVLAEVSKIDPNLAIQLVDRIRLTSPTVQKKDKQ
jgi:flagellar motility protein MotE (MotC chaperone)